MDDLAKAHVVLYVAYETDFFTRRMAVQLPLVSESSLAQLVSNGIITKSDDGWYNVKRFPPRENLDEMTSDDRKRLYGAARDVLRGQWNEIGHMYNTENRDFAAMKTERLSVHFRRQFETREFDMHELVQWLITIDGYSTAAYVIRRTIIERCINRVNVGITPDIVKKLQRELNDQKKL